MFQGKAIFSTLFEDCVTSPAGINTDTLSPCSQEEADTRVFLHVSAATLAGHRQVILRTSDSDVVILAVANFVALGERIDELWIAFGTGRNFRFNFRQFGVSSKVILLLGGGGIQSQVYINHNYVCRYIPVHAVAESLGQSKAVALPAFHALTGSDTTSTFYGKGKKTAWSVLAIHA